MENESLKASYANQTNEEMRVIKQKDDIKNIAIKTPLPVN